MKRLTSRRTKINAATSGSPFGPANVRELKEVLDQYDPGAAQIIREGIMVPLNNGKTAIITEGTELGEIGWTYVVVDLSGVDGFSGNEVIENILADWVV